MTAIDPEVDPRGLSAALERIARRVVAEPYNRSGSDKTWVLRTMWSCLLFRHTVANAKRVPDR